MTTHLQKYPNEKFTVSVEWSGQLPASTTISTGTVAVYNLESKSNQSSVMLVSTTLSVAGTLTSAVIQGGVSGTTYEVRFSITLDDGSILEERVLIAVL